MRELTDIEESILGSVVEIICRELTAAWQPVGLSFNFERRQMQTQVARIMSVTEKTLCLSFEIRMPHSSGLLNLAFPAVVANTILRRLTSDWGRSRRHAGETRARMEAAARRIRFGGSLQLPTVRLAASSDRKSGAGNGSAPGSARQHLARLAGGRPADLPEAQAIRQGAHRGSPHRAHRSGKPKHEDLSRVLDRRGHGPVFAGPGRRAAAGRVAAQAACRRLLWLCRHRFAETSEGRFAVVLDGSILESPLVGEGVDQKAGWGELLREVADAAAGELLAKTGEKCQRREV